VDCSRFALNYGKGPPDMSFLCYRGECVGERDLHGSVEICSDP